MAPRLFWQLFLSYLLATVGVLALVALQAGPALRKFHSNQVNHSLQCEARIFAELVEPALWKHREKNAAPADKTVEAVKKAVKAEDTAHGEEQNNIAPAGQDDGVADIDAVAKRLGRSTATRLTLIDSSGRVLADSQEDPARMDNHAGRPEIVTALTARGVGRETRYSATIGQDFCYVAVPIFHGESIVGVARASMPMTTAERALQLLQKRVALGAIAAVIAITAVSWWLARRISRPLESMTAAASRFARGELDHRLPVKGCREIETLAAALDAMAAELNDRIDTITQQRNRHQAILASMSEGVMALDTSSKIITINEAGSRMLALDSAQVRGRPIYEVLRQPALLEFVEQTLSGDEIRQDDLVIRDTADLLLNARGTTLCDAQGNKIGGLIVFQDVTQLRRLETVRQDFVANVSHELRTPITSIKGYVETLSDGALHDQQNAERFLEIIVKQADRLNAVIEDILALSRIEEQSQHLGVPLAPGSIRETLEAVVQLIRRHAADKQIQVLLECPQDLQANINRTLLEQAVLNLVNNAINYSPPQSTVLIKAQSDGGTIVISVVDHGCGIEEKHLSRLFERFYRVDRARSNELGGTGLGLAIVKHIALAHGGSVAVESRVGAGSTFSIRIPLQPRRTD